MQLYFLVRFVLSNKVINSRKTAYKLLDSIGAPEHLKTHLVLVGEAADLLIEQCEKLSLDLDFNFIRTGVAIHDIGKIVHLHEMNGPGSDHEPEGEKILLEKGASSRLARVCLTHARWREMRCSTEELLIALSDKLWKGKRVEELEIEVIDRIAKLLKVGRWDIFSDLDLCFEEIASDGHKRLQRSSIGQSRSHFEK